MRSGNTRAVLVRVASSSPCTSGQTSPIRRTHEDAHEDDTRTTARSREAPVSPCPSPSPCACVLVQTPEEAGGSSENKQLADGRRRRGDGDGQRRSSASSEAGGDVKDVDPSAVFPRRLAVVQRWRCSALSSTARRLAALRLLFVESRGRPRQRRRSSKMLLKISSINDPVADGFEDSRRLVLAHERRIRGKPRVQELPQRQRGCHRVEMPEDALGRRTGRAKCGT